MGLNILSDLFDMFDISSGDTPIGILLVGGIFLTAFGAILSIFGFGIGGGIIIFGIILVGVGIGWMIIKEFL